MGYTGPTTQEKILQLKRHVEARRWDPRNATHFNTGILARIAGSILAKIPAEVCRITRIPMPRFNVLFSLSVQGWYCFWETVPKNIPNKPAVVNKPAL